MHKKKERPELEVDDETQKAQNQTLPIEHIAIAIKGYVKVSYLRKYLRVFFVVRTAITNQKVQKSHESGLSAESTSLTGRVSSSFQRNRREKRRSLGGGFYFKPNLELEERAKGKFLVRKQNKRFHFLLDRTCRRTKVPFF